MKKDEFIKKINQFGVNLEDINVGITEDKFLPGFICCSNGVLNEGRFLIFKVRDNGDYDILYHGKEDIIWAKFYKIMFTQLKEYGYINNKITRRIVEVNNTKIIQYMKNSYGLTELNAISNLNLLKSNFKVFNEFKYYMLNGYFIQGKTVVSYEGYTAQKIFETTRVNILEAFNQLLELKNKQPIK